MLQEDAMWDENKKKKNNMGFINICNNPLKPKFHISLDTFTWQFNMNNLSTPLPKGEIFENDNFKTAYSISIQQYLLVCIQNIARRKNTGSLNIRTPLNFRR